MPDTGCAFGDWRVIYTLRDDALLVLAVRIAHRREAYR
jgi:mRNA-degrading endonuclease RelE of RelBE toxin-antitoxin system